MIGAVLEKYEVLEKIGEGGMATVYRARHTTLDRTVAVKVMHPHLSSSEKNRSRFAREARAIESLRHPNILRIFDYSGPASEKCFIVTEFIEGPTLSELLEEVGAMMSEPAALVAVELCRALTIAHDHGIVHRDLKPENVMIHVDGSVKLMDFGIARLRDDVQVTMTGALVGSPAYMSPEQATSGELDARSDLFSLGTVLYRMVTGTLPFRGTNPSVVLKNIIDCTYTDPEERVPSLSSDLAGVIRRLLTQSAQDRYGSAAEVQEDLTRSLRSLGIDPDAPGEWSVLSYLEDPDSYEDLLRTYLVATLTARGRVEVDAGRPADALRTLNRVLALDEDNREVVDILEGMRPPLAESGRRSAAMLWLAPFGILALAVVALVFGRGDTQEAPPEPVLHRIAPVPMLAVPVAEAPGPNDRAAPRPEATPAALARALERPVAAVAPEATPLRRVQPRVEEPDDEPPEPVRVEEPVYTGTARMLVTTNPTGIEVFVDGASRGYTPMKHFDLPAGKHTVRLDREFVVPQEFEVNVPPWDAGTDAFEVNRRLDYRPSTVQFSGFPPDVRVQVNGRDAGLAAGNVVTIDDMSRDWTFTLMQGETVLVRESVRRGIDDGDLLPGQSHTIRYAP